MAAPSFRQERIQMQEYYGFAVTPLVPQAIRQGQPGPAFTSPRQQLSESREVGLLVLGTAITEWHRSEDKPDPATTTRDSRHGVESTRLTSYRRVKQKGVHLRNVGQRSIRQGLVQVGTMLAADIQKGRPSGIAAARREPKRVGIPLPKRVVLRLRATGLTPRSLPVKLYRAPNQVTSPGRES
jgi:hypothetical protein